MRLLMKLMLTAGMVFAFSSQASAVAVNLVQIGGPATPVPSDVITFDIQVVLEAGDAVTLIDPGIDMMGASFVGGTEAPYNFVGGVLLSPIATGDINVYAPNKVQGWEASTLNGAGAPGPATFSIGTASFHVGGPNVWLTMDTTIGGLGTVIGGAAFADITTSTTFGNYHLVPEPTTAGLMTLGLIGLVVAGRRR
jgi:hypothetical protein